LHLSMISLGGWKQPNLTKLGAEHTHTFSTAFTAAGFFGLTRDNFEVLDVNIKHCDSLVCSSEWDLVSSSSHAFAIALLNNETSI
jgi:hypothetical protein